MKRRYVYLITLLAGLLLTLILAACMGVFAKTKPQELFHVISDAFFVSGVVLAGLGGLFVGAKAIDITRDTIAHAKAKQKLNAYYQALSVKQNLLIEEQQKIILRLSNDIDLLEDEQEQIQKTINIMAKTITAIQEKTAAKKA